MRAQSRGLGHGSEFVVELPWDPAARTPRTEPKAAAPPIPVGAQQKRVLVVDDNEDAAMMLQHALRSLGYVVEVAPDALRRSTFA